VTTRTVGTTELREYSLPIHSGLYCYTIAKRLGLRRRLGTDVRKTKGLVARLAVTGCSRPRRVRICNGKSEREDEP
jgi:hypothetical protein